MKNRNWIVALALPMMLASCTGEDSEILRPGSDAKSDHSGFEPCESADCPPSTTEFRCELFQDAVYTCVVDYLELAGWVEWHDGDCLDCDPSQQSGDEVEDEAWEYCTMDSEQIDVYREYSEDCRVEASMPPQWCSSPVAEFTAAHWLSCVDGFYGYEPVLEDDDWGY